MQLAVPTDAPMRVLATVDRTNRSNRSMDPRTLVLDGPTSEAWSDLEGAIEATSVATKGARVGAAAILQQGDGTYVARAVLDLADGAAFEIERSRAKRTIVTGQMDVLATDVAAIVDGSRVERMPDYAAANPASWQDRRLFELVGSDGQARWGFSSQRSRYARTDASHFTKVGDDFDASVKRAMSSTRRDGGLLMVLQDDAGSFHMTDFTGSREVLFDRARIANADPAIRAIVGAEGVLQQFAPA